MIAGLKPHAAKFLKSKNLLLLQELKNILNYPDEGFPTFGKVGNSSVWPEAHPDSKYRTRNPEMPEKKRRKIDTRVVRNLRRI